MDCFFPTIWVWASFPKTNFFRDIAWGLGKSECMTTIPQRPPVSTTLCPLVPDSLPSCSLRKTWSHWSLPETHKLTFLFPLDTKERGSETFLCFYCWCQNADLSFFNYNQTNMKVNGFPQTFANTRMLLWCNKGKETTCDPYLWEH